MKYFILKDMNRISLNWVYKFKVIFRDWVLRT